MSIEEAIMGGIVFKGKKDKPKEEEKVKTKAKKATYIRGQHGSGIIGRLNNMPGFFQRMKRILRPGGCILMDSSDLRYLFEEEDGSIVIDLAGDYYGEIDFQMQYKNVKGDTFDWLYVDFQTLSLYASECGFKAELVKEGKHYDYLVKLSIA